MNQWQPFKMHLLVIGNKRTQGKARSFSAWSHGRWPGILANKRRYGECIWSFELNGCEQSERRETFFWTRWSRLDWRCHHHQGHILLYWLFPDIKCVPVLIGWGAGRRAALFISVNLSFQWRSFQRNHLQTLGIPWKINAPHHRQSKPGCHRFGISGRRCIGLTI